jgi:outer membrane protein W
MTNLLKTFVLAALLTATAVGQNQMSGISWNIGIPTGQMSSYMDKISYGGFGVEFHKFTGENTSVGILFSWNVWSNLTGDIIPFSNGGVSGAVSGTQIRYYNSFPILLNVHYYLNEKNAEFRPYAGLNVGTYYILQRLDIGTWSLSNDQWHFGLAPEAGFMVEVSNRTYLNVNARYNYAFDSGSTLGGKDDNSLAYWGINAGLVWYTGWF